MEPRYRGDGELSERWKNWVDTESRGVWRRAERSDRTSTTAAKIVLSGRESCVKSLFKTHENSQHSIFSFVSVREVWIVFMQVKSRHQGQLEGWNTRP